MEELIKYIEESVTDHAFSRSDKRNLKEKLAAFGPARQDLDFIRSRVFDLAMSKATADNYELVLGWLEGINKVLLPAKTETAESQSFFSPGDECRSAILYQLRMASSIVRICVFTISDDIITREILATQARGVEVRVLTDNDKLHDLGSDVSEMAEKGVPVKIDYTKNHMHHKFMVIDRDALLTGSYNWTRSAAKYNHENILLSKDQGSINAFVDEFDKLWQEMEFYHG